MRAFGEVLKSRLGPFARYHIIVAMQPIDWRAHIEIHPRRLDGRPFVRGTELTVETVLELLSAGATPSQLTEEQIRACLSYASEAVYRDRFAALLTERIAEADAGGLQDHDSVVRRLRAEFSGNEDSDE